jgi:hypothetical protein
MGGVCSTHRRGQKCEQNFSRKICREGRDLDVSERVILEWIFKGKKLDIVD